MKAKERQRLHQTYDHLYDVHYGGADEMHKCFYCSDHADTFDHCPPLSRVESKTTDDWRNSGTYFVKVKACFSCNVMLGNKPFFTLRERAYFLEDALLTKFEKQSKLWTEDEIAEMSPDFQRTIRAKQRDTKQLLARARMVQWRLLQYETFPDEN